MSNGPALSTLQRFVAVDIPRAQIKNAPYNPRKISADARVKLESSLKEFGLVEPFVWNRRTGNLVGGHQRLSTLDNLMAARLADETAAENEIRLPGMPEVKRDPMAYTVTVAAVDLPAEKEKALNIALNARGAQGEYDSDLLSTLLADIGENDFDITGLLDKSEKKLLKLLQPPRRSTNHHHDDDNESAAAASVASLEEYEPGSFELSDGNIAPETARSLPAESVSLRGVSRTALIDYLERDIPADKHARLREQWNDAVESHSITCGCGQLRAIELAYRCYYCGEWYCSPCAKLHFGRAH